MNRIQLLDHDLTHQDSSTQNARQPLLNKARSSTVEHSFFVPLHYEPNYAYPLLVWLHGPDDDHTQLKRVMPHISMRNYVAVSAGRVQRLEDDQDLSSDSNWPQTHSGITDALFRVNECVRLASRRFNIAQHRIFLAGYDGGGTMALRLGLTEPERFAGVASMGGPVPDGLNPLANVLQARQLPMLIAHGRDSEAYPIQRICEELRLFHVAGLSLNLRQYPCGHELTTQMLSDLDAWMMQIVTGVESESETMDYLRYDEN